MRGLSKRGTGTAVGIWAAALLVAACGSTSEAPPVSNSGFDVTTNGFSFKNYGNEDGVANLDAGQMQKLFGDVVCARKEGSDCTLTPTAKVWMEKINDSMDGGHCFGMAGLAWAMFKNEINPQTYGGPNAAALEIKNNVPLQTELAGVMATQYTNPTKSAAITATPNDVITKLKEAWTSGSGYNFGIYQLVDGKQTGGHAITPVAVSDGSGGTTAVTVYDNNFPKEPRTLTIDNNANSWSYSTAADPKNDPEVYTGSGTTNELELDPVAPMIKPQECPFCTPGSDVADSSQGSAQSPSQGAASDSGAGFNMVLLNQQAGHSGVSLSVTAPDGSPIPDLETFAPFSMDAAQTIPDAFFVPQDEPFQIKIDGTALKAQANTDVSIIGPGYGYSVDQIDMRPGETDTIVFDPNEYKLSYQTDTGSAPDIVLSLDGKGVSYGFLFGGLELGKKGGKIDVALDPAKQTVSASGGGSGDAVIDFSLNRVSQTSDETYSSDAIPLAKNEQIIIDYGKWKGNGQPMPVGIDKNNDGTVDETLVFPDK